MGLQRWSVKETRHLLQVYTGYIRKKGNRRKIAWDSLLEELDFNLPKRFTVYQIKAKIRNCLQTYNQILEKKRKGNWPLFRDVEKLCKLEKGISTANEDVMQDLGQSQGKQPSWKNTLSLGQTIQLTLT